MSDDFWIKPTEWELQRNIFNSTVQATDLFIETFNKMKENRVSWMTDDLGEAFNNLEAFMEPGIQIYKNGLSVLKSTEPPPCPFCGHAALYHENTHKIACSNCPASMYNEDMLELFMLWGQRRHTDDWKKALEAYLLRMMSGLILIATALRSGFMDFVDDNAHDIHHPDLGTLLSKVFKEVDPIYSNITAWSTQLNEFIETENKQGVDE